MINLRYFCFVVIQLYLKVRALALFYFINLHHYTYITQIYLRNTSGWANIGYFRCIAYNCQNKIHRNSGFSSNPDVFQLISRDSTRFSSKCIPAQADFNKNIHRNDQKSGHPDVFTANNHSTARCISAYPISQLYISSYCLAEAYQLQSAAMPRSIILFHSRFLS